MRKCVLILGLITALNAKADDEITIIAQTDPNNASTKCGDNCTWTLYSDGKLEISGTGDMYDDFSAYNTENFIREGSLSRYQTLAPWGQYSGQISEIKINQGITSIGGMAFYNTAATSAEIADSVRKIRWGAFEYSDLQTVSIPDSVVEIVGPAFHAIKASKIIIPSSVSEIGYYAFGSNDRLENMFIPENITFINNKAFSDNTNATIYCPSAELCAGKGSDNIQVYTKDENGVYSITQDGITSYFSSPEKMVAGTTCNNNDGTCASEAAQYKAQKAQSMAGGTLCATPEDCLKLMDMASAGTNCTTIASCSQWLKLNRQEINPDGSLSIYKDGQFVGYKNKRIYTVEEANAVAGKVNTFKIKYR